MATFTTRLLLRKPDPDPVTGDNVDVATDINASMDKLDAAVGFHICTSGTRPVGAERWDGRGILETDTLKAYVWSATGASWLQLLIGSAQFNAGLRADRLGLGVAPGAGSQLIKTIAAGGGSTAQVLIETSSAATGHRAISFRGSGDTQDHYILDFDGTMQWSSGGAAADVNLKRASANLLRTDDAFDATLDVLRANRSLPRGIMGTPTVLNGSGTPTAADGVEVRDALLGNYVFTAETSRRYRVVLCGLKVNLSIASANCLINIHVRDGGASTPTTGSTSVANSASHAAVAGGSGQVTIHVEKLVTFSAGTHTLGAFTIRSIAGAGNPAITPTGDRQLYVEDIGPV